MREKRSVRKPENHLGYKIFLTRQGSNFNVFDTFSFLTKGQEAQDSNRVYGRKSQRRRHKNAASADGSAGSERSFPGGLALGKLLWPQ
jgi:hypothetical protein